MALPLEERLFFMPKTLDHGADYGNIGLEQIERMER